MNLLEEANRINDLIKQSETYQLYLEKREMLKANKESYDLYCKIMKMKYENEDSHLSFEKEKEIASEAGTMLLIEEIRDYMEAKNKLISEISILQDLISKDLDIDLY